MEQRKGCKNGIKLYHSAELWSYAVTQAYDTYDETGLYINNNRTKT